MALELLRDPSCCGARVLNNLSHPLTAEEAFVEFIRQCGRVDASGKPYLPFAIVTFSGVTLRFQKDHASGRMDDYGSAFANYIANNKLGSVVASDEVKNPASSNHIRVWVWTMDRDTVTKHAVALTTVDASRPKELAI